MVAKSTTCEMKERFFNLPVIFLLVRVAPKIQLSIVFFFSFLIFNFFSRKLPDVHMFLSDLKT